MTSDRSTSSNNNVRFIKPPNILKQKVGHGGISEERLEKSQQFVNNIEVDFTPYAKQFLTELSAKIKDAQGNDNFEKVRDGIIAPIMQLKANGGMFRYQLVSDVADIALQFVEAIDEINQDGLNVLKAHENTIKIIVSSNLRGDGGAEGYALVKELDKARRRYFTKYKKD